MYTVNVSPKAQEDVIQIKAYISEELGNEVAGENIVDLIVEKIRSLQEFPYTGCVLANKLETQTDYRYLICKNYLIFYRIENTNVFIVRVIYSKRDYTKLLFDEL